MHLRRALLLFAIVLGLAAVAASVSRPGRSSDTEQPFRTPPATTDDQPTVTAAAGPKPGLAPVERTFLASEPGPQRIHAGQAATILVDVMEPGQVDIADLALSAAAEPLTPARFDVLTRRVGRYPISFVPAIDQAATERIGTLVVVED